jgi:uncharacterized protein YeaO (DUF488 family)
VTPNDTRRLAATRRRPEVEIRRIYDHADDDGGYRLLVDRLWPRGVAKANAPIDEWAKDLAPSTELRRWYGHDPVKFEEFARRYRDELEQPPASEAVGRLRARARRQRIVLVTATRDVEHSGAWVLARVVSEKT